MEGHGCPLTTRQVPGPRSSQHVGVPGLRVLGDTLLLCLSLSTVGSAPLPPRQKSPVVSRNSTADPQDPSPQDRPLLSLREILCFGHRPISNLNSFSLGQGGQSKARWPRLLSIQTGRRARSGAPCHSNPELAGSPTGLGSSAGLPPPPRPRLPGPAPCLFRTRMRTHRQSQFRSRRKALSLWLPNHSFL